MKIRSTFSFCSVFLPVLRLEDLNAALAEHGRDAEPVDGFVLHQQHTQGAHPALVRKMQFAALRRSRLRGRPERQADGEGRSPAHLALHGHGTAHEGHEAAHDAQPETGALAALLACAFPLPERLEDHLEALAVDARTGVRNQEQKMPVAFGTVRQHGSIQPHLPAARELHRVAEQVRQDLQQTVLIPRDHDRQIVRHVHRKADPGLARSRLEEFPEGMQQLPQVERLALNQDLAGLHAR